MTFRPLARAARATLAAAFAAALCCPAIPAHAELADREKPINLDAQRGTYDGLKNIQVLEGDVTIVQGTMRITAARAEVHRDKDNAVSAIATGSPVTFRQKREGCDEWIEAVADRAEFDERADTLRLISHAKLKLGGDEGAGDLIVYNSATESYQILGDRKETKADGRVSIVIQPHDKKTGKACGSGKKPAAR